MSKMQRQELEHDVLLTAIKKAESLTGGFSAVELEHLGAVAKVEWWPSGESITQEDERSRDLFIVAKGALSVEVRRTQADPQSTSLLKLREGSVAGELAFIDGQRRSAGLRAVGDTVVIRLPYEKVWALCEAETGVGFRILRNLSQLVTQRMRNAIFELRATLY